MPLGASDVGKPLADVLKRSEFSASRVRELHRTEIARAPGGRVALQMNIPKGENKLNAFWLDPLGNPGVDAACLSLNVYFPSGFQWAPGGGKMAWGLWGGDRAHYLSGGTPPSQQEGWSVRNVTGNPGFRLYSYNLNRPDNHGQYSVHSPKWMSSDWRTERWHKIEMEIVMNTPGKADGYAQMWLDGKNLRTMRNLVFRKDTKWKIRGLMWADLWGGTTSDPNRMSPRKQNMWYADYKLYTMKGGAAPSVAQSPSSDEPSTNSPSEPTSSNAGGAFGAIAPSGTVGGSNVTAQWTADTNADRYFIKVVNRANKNTVFHQTVHLNPACSGSTCRSSMGNFPKGSYDWMVRPVYGSSQGKYSVLAFEISK